LFESDLKSRETILINIDSFGYGAILDFKQSRYHNYYPFLRPILGSIENNNDYLCLASHAKTYVTSVFINFLPDDTFNVIVRAIPGACIINYYDVKISGKITHEITIDDVVVNSDHINTELEHYEIYKVFDHGNIIHLFHTPYETNYSTTNVAIPSHHANLTITYNYGKKFLYRVFESDTSSKIGNKILYCDKFDDIISWMEIIWDKVKFDCTY